MTDEYEEHLRIKAIIEEQQRLLRENPKLKGKTDAQLWGDELRSRAAKARYNDPEFKRVIDENRNLALKKVYDTAEWREKQKIGGQKRSDSAEWRENQKAGAQKNANNVEWREKHKAGVQKALNKKISCDGVIYESGKTAALALAPETRLTVNSKKQWLKHQKRKYPERFFYIDEE